MNRRMFFSFLPLGPAVVGAAIVSESQKQDSPSRELLTLNLNKKTVDMSIGKDGKLWIRSDNDWKRVVTEG